MHRVRRYRYEDVVLRTRPVFYVPCQGNQPKEIVRQVACTVNNANDQRSGPFPGASARDFNGSTSEIITATHTSYHPGDTFSVGGWVRRDGSGTGGHTFLHNGTGDFVLWIDTTNKLVLRRAGTGDIFSSTATYTDTLWMYAIATKNAGSGTVMYVNGIAIAGTTTAQTVVASSSAPTIGRVSGGTGNPLDGSAVHMAIWSRALTQAEVTELYRAGREFK